MARIAQEASSRIMASASSSDQLPLGYGFVEWSRRYTNQSTLNGDRILTGLLLQY
jgi:hypothetical protein